MGLDENKSFVFLTLAEVNANRWNSVNIKFREIFSETLNMDRCASFEDCTYYSIY